VRDMVALVTVRKCSPEQSIDVLSTHGRSTVVVEELTRAVVESAATRARSAEIPGYAA